VSVTELPELDAPPEPAPLLLLPQAATVSAAVAATASAALVRMLRMFGHLLTCWRKRRAGLPCLVPRPGGYDTGSVATWACRRVSRVVSFMSIVVDNVL
jgi:hypothetical protein